MNDLPVIVHTNKEGDQKHVSLTTRLFMDRIILINGAITEDTSRDVISQLLCLANEDSKKPITLWIQSPGGSCNAGLAIIDTMKAISNPVYTRGYGLVASMAAVILAAGERGNRKVLPNCRIMIHQPSGGASGQITDMKIMMDEGELMKTTLTSMMSLYCKENIKIMTTLMERDKFMSASEAMKLGKYGLIDCVIEKLN